MSTRQDILKGNFTLHQPPFELQSADALLKNKKNQRNLLQIQKIANVPAAHYDALYNSTLLAYAAYVQELPASHVSGYTGIGGLLELGIERALRALLLYRKEFPLKNITPEDMPRQWALYTYALFTAGLFYGVGQITATYIISLCNKKGDESQRWVPSSGPMINTAFTHYRYTLDSANRDALAARATPLAAQLLMPSAGFNWLASDVEVFDYWLAILQNDEKHGSLFAKIVRAAQDEILQQTLIQTQADITSTLDTLEKEMMDFSQALEEATPLEAAKNPEVNLNHLVAAGFAAGNEITAAKILGPNGSESLGQVFINWLRHVIGSKNPLANQVITGRDGVFIKGQDLIKKFMETNNITADAHTVLKALQKNTLSIARQATGSSVQTYFIVKDVTQVLNTGHLPPQTDAIKTPNISSLQETYPDLSAHANLRPTNTPMK